MNAYPLSPFIVILVKFGTRVIRLTPLRNFEFPKNKSIYRLYLLRGLNKILTLCTFCNGFHTIIYRR